MDIERPYSDHRRWVEALETLLILRGRDERGIGEELPLATIHNTQTAIARKWDVHEAHFSRQMRLGAFRRAFDFSYVCRLSLEKTISNLKQSSRRLRRRSCIFGRCSFRPRSSSSSACSRSVVRRAPLCSKIDPQGIVVASQEPSDGTPAWKDSRGGMMGCDPQAG